MMVVASIAFIFTPDTRGQALVQTVDELVKYHKKIQGYALMTSHTF